MDSRTSAKLRLSLRKPKSKASTRPSSPEACVQKLPGLVVKHQNFARSSDAPRDSNVDGTEDDAIDETDAGNAQKVPMFCVTKAAKLPKEDESNANSFFSPPNSALIDASKGNSPCLCRELLDNFPALNPNLPSPGWTALHFAAHRGYVEVVDALLDYLDRLELNPKTERLQTPLHLACQQNHLEVTKTLVRAGANINVIDFEGNSPLHLAVSKGFGDVVEWLVTKGGDLTIRNLAGNTAADLAVKEVLGKVISGLRRREAMENSLPMKSRTMSTPAMARVKPSPHDFQPLQSLGRGSFGEVFLVEHRHTSRLYAMKVLSKGKLHHQNLIKYALVERSITENVKHPFIVGLKYAFQTEERLFLILDYCPGGDLGWHLKRERKFSEARARIYLCEVVLALEELHKRNVIFRDLKPDNVLLDGEGHAMLTDFGLSKVINDDETTSSFCGSVAYLAPEILLRNGHGKAVDWYLLGVILYEMLVGQPPYYTPNHKQLFANILKGKLRLPSYLSVEARGFLTGVSGIQLLQREPCLRLGSSKRDAEEVKEHRFFYGVDWNAVWRRELKPPILPRPTLDLGTISEERAFGNIGAEKSDNCVTGWSFVGGSYQD